MYKVVIVDDEIDSQIALNSFLKEYCPEVDIVATFLSVKECIRNIFSLSPDILLLDINLSDGTGFDVLKEISDLQTRVILITAFEEFALKAFKYQVDNYLLKPINPKDLQKAIVKSIEVIESKKELKELKLLVDSPNIKKIGIPFKGTLRIMSLQEIIRCEANGNYTYIIIENKDRIIIPKTIKKFEELLSLHGFIRTHQSHLINQQFIKKIEGKNNYVNLLNNDIIPISRKYKSNLLDALKFKFI